jgi:hypothetical protein
MTERRYTGPALQNVDFKAGTLHYIGNFTGRTSSGVSSNIHELRWSLEEHVNHFGETTSRVLTERPRLGAFRRVDVSGVPEEAAPGKEARQ